RVGHSVVLADPAAPAGGMDAAPRLGATAFTCGAGNDAPSLLSRAAEAVGRIGAVLRLAPLGERSSPDATPEWEPLLWSQRLARSHAGAFIVATSQDGKLGTESGTLLGAALAGHAKALARERVDELVKAIDLDPKEGVEAMADAILSELRSGNASPEVGIRGGVRYEPDLLPAAGGEPLSFGPGDVVLVTGGARGVGAKLAIALAGPGCAMA